MLWPLILCSSVRDMHEACLGTGRIHCIPIRYRGVKLIPSTILYAVSIIAQNSDQPRSNLKELDGHVPSSNHIAIRAALPGMLSCLASSSY